MADVEDRVLSAYRDVIAVEHTSPGMVRVITWGGAYTVDARHEVCECPDYEYNLDGEGRCKHLYSALDATDQLPHQTFELVESVDERAVMADGGGERPDDCDCPPSADETDLACWPCFRDGYETARTEAEP